MAAPSTLLRAFCLTFPLLSALPASQQPALGEAFEVPEGFRVSLFAESPDLYNPTAMAVDQRGRIWVTEAVNYRKWEGRNPGREHPEGDRVVVLEDTDHDGRADVSKVFVQDPELRAPLGIAVLGSRVFVSSSPHLFVYHDDDGDDVADRRETFLSGFGGFDHDHGLHSVVVGPDGRLVFNAGNAGPHVVTDANGWTLRSGSIYNGGGPRVVDNRPGLLSDDGRVWTGGIVLSVGEDGGGLQVLAHNFRNNYEVAVDSYGDLFQSDNDDDGNASCRVLWCMEGANHGYFSADGARYWSLDRRPGQDTQAAHWHQDDPGVVPYGTITGAGGPTGVCVYEVANSPLSGSVFAADAGAGVVYHLRPQVRGSGFELPLGRLIEPRAIEGESTRDERLRGDWFRPSDVTYDAQGVIYVADWFDPGVGGHWAGDREAYGRILRLEPPPITTPPDGSRERWVAQGPAQMLVSPIDGLRQRAVRLLKAQGPDAVRSLLPLRDRKDRWMWARALWVLVHLGEQGVGHVERELARAEERMAVTAFRALRAAGRDMLYYARGLADSPHAGLRREIALAMRDVSYDESREVLLELARHLEPDDRFALEAFGIGAEGKEEELYSDLAAEHGDVPSAWSERFERLAWRLHPAAAIGAFAARAKDASLAQAARRRAIDALGFRPERAAGEAVLDLALGGPDDTRELARFWLEHNDRGSWHAHGLPAQLPPEGLEQAELVWESELIRDGLRAIDVSLGDAERLWLVVDDAGNGNSCDWADWIEPRLHAADAKVPPLRLTEREPQLAEAAWGTVQRGANAVGDPLAVDGETFREGIGTHAFSRIAFEVPQGYDRLSARIGPDDGGTKQVEAPPTSIRFRVYVERRVDPARLATLRERAFDGTVSEQERDAALRALAEDEQGAWHVLDAARDGVLDEDRRELVAEALYRHPDLAVRALASEHFRRPRSSSATLPSVDALLGMDGDARRGRAVFFGEKASCSTCHVVRRGDVPRGGDVGPDLTRVREKLGREALLDAILNPNAGIAFGYDTWVVEDDEGRLLSGFLLADGEDVVLKDTRGVRHVLPAESIVDRYRQDLSTMPEGVALGLEAQELADLLAFLGDDQEREPRFGPWRDLVLDEGLDGWTFVAAEGDVPAEEVWSIREDGVLACEGQPYGYLHTREDFESFELELEWRFDPARGPGNSGVLLRVVGEHQVWPKSIEAQLMHENAGDIYNIGAFDMETDPTRTRGRRTARAKLSSEKPLGEWNHYRILLDRGHLRLEVNDVLQNEAYWCAEVPGKIALQSEGAAIEFRNVRVRAIEG